MSHFIKDSDGNYHEYSDEEYAELQREDSRQGSLALGFVLMVFGLIGASIFGFLLGKTIIIWIGIGVSIIGALVYKAYSTKSEFIFAIICLILAYGGAYWLCDKINSMFHLDSL